MKPKFDVNQDTYELLSEICADLEALKDRLDALKECFAPCTPEQAEQFAASR